MNLAVLGFGNVARALARLLHQQRGAHPFRINAIHTRHGTACNVSGLSTDPEFGPPAASLEEVLERAKAQVLVELTTLNPENGEPALTHIPTALRRGLHVVTANKGPVACAYHGLRDEARRHNVRFLHEAVTMDGTPVYNMVRQCLPAATVTGFAGALNSTTKVILEAMARGHSFEEGIAQARALGVAEGDPWFDIEGWDSACKAAALANVWMDARTTPAQVDRKGIRQLTPEKLAEAAAKGKRIVLVSRARRTAQGVKLRVRAEVLDRDDVLASMHGTSNLLVLETDLMGQFGVFTLNPGPEQTAYGVFADLMEIARNS